MELTHQDVLDILSILEGSDVTHLEVVVGDTRIVARDGEAEGPGHSERTGIAVPIGEPTAYAAAPDPATAVAAPSGPVERQPVAPTEPMRGSTSASSTAGDVMTVTAPVVGVFYRAAEPGALPYTEVGARVEQGATLGLVEVMKMFNSITAEVGGEVVEILAANEEFVEFGQPLLTIRPDAPG